MLLRHVDAGRAALARGEWEEAKRAFDAALATEETGEALEGLGLAAWWLDLADVVFDARERAYRIYHEQNNRSSAARVAVWLAWDTAAFRGEHAIATGWLQRARRLLDDQPPAPEHAWLALRSGVSALLHDGSPEHAAALAAKAISIGEAIGSADYTVAGRALHGYAEITAGRVADGLRTLDEVSASVLAGEVKDYVLMGLACCYLIAACDRIRDYDRATQWCDRLTESCKKWGLRPLFAVCRTQYASVCMWRGAWDEAERELSAATDELAACRPAMTGEGLARLGELRRRQGKLDEATTFFERAGTHPMASLGRAMLAFDRDDFKAASELADRYLRKLPLQNRTERAAGLELLIRAQTELGNRVDAAKALEELRDIAARAQTDPLRASAALSAGVVAARSGDAESARRHFEDAVDLFQKAVRRSRPRGRVSSWRACLERSAELTRRPKRPGVRSKSSRSCTRSWNWTRARKVLADLSSPASGSAAQAQAPRREERGGLTRRELEVLKLVSIGLSNHAIAERLFISEHTVHRHVANALTKLNVSSRSAAVAQVARLGIL